MFYRFFTKKFIFWLESHLGKGLTIPPPLFFIRFLKKFRGILFLIGQKSEILKNHFVFDCFVLFYKFLFLVTKLKMF